MMDPDETTTSIGDTHRARIADALTRAGLRLPEVWLRYFSITGTVDEYEIDAYLHQMIVLPGVECDKLAHAINELIDEKPPPVRAPYRGDFTR